jgi:hypothetical protein
MMKTDLSFLVVGSGAGAGAIGGITSALLKKRKISHDNFYEPIFNRF